MECSVRTNDEKDNKIFNIEITTENYHEQLFVMSILDLIRYTYLVTKNKNKK